MVSLRFTVYSGKLFLILLLMVGQVGLQGQDVTVVTGSAMNMTPQEFVQTYLIGEGVVVTNALFNGSADPLNSPERLPLPNRDQIGTFQNSSNAQAVMGLSGGVILSTGYVTGAIIGSGTSGNMWGSYPGESDPDLVILADGATINDKSILEFDFVPVTEVVSFRYVFSSREFDEFCGWYNDAFGLLLSGPGINGGAGFLNDAVNIAVLPNTNSFVNINNICEPDSGVAFGVYSWQNMGEKKVFYSYDRLTYVFTATYSVECDQTYHMRFVIGDALDGSLDSGVFLEENSFSSVAVASNTSYSNPLTSSYLVEGCNSVALSFSIPQPQQTDLIIDLAIHPSGTASQQDILPNPFPQKDTIFAGQTQTEPITIIPVLDPFAEPMENLVVKGSTSSCGSTYTLTTEFPILDLAPISVTLDDLTLCHGELDTLIPVMTGGQMILPDSIYFYKWSTGDTTPFLVVAPPPGHHIYSLTVTDACGQTGQKQISVDVGSIPAAAAPITGADYFCTPVSDATFSIPEIPGADTYVWTFPPGTTMVSGMGTNSVTVDIPVSASSDTMVVFGRNYICGDGAPSKRFTEIHPAVPPAGIITGLSYRLCQGNIQYTCFTQPLDFATSYEWTFPPGTTVLSQTDTTYAVCVFGPASASGNVTVRGYNPACGYGLPSSFSVTIDPLPLAAGPITSLGGSMVCAPQSGQLYQVNTIAYATSYQWIFTGSAASLNPAGNQLSIDFTETSTSGSLTVRGINYCGTGNFSPVFDVTVHPKPVVDFLVCEDIRTTKNARPIWLKGGRPRGEGGLYKGTGVIETTSGTFVFDPADPRITVSGVTGTPYTVTYRYTNRYNCAAEKDLNFLVFASNHADPCPGIVKDVRDNTLYPTFSITAPYGEQCWLAANLRFGTFRSSLKSSSDDCIHEKYCPDDEESACDFFGGLYQWDEIMNYQTGTLIQDICMPGWHLATAQEWQNLIDVSSGNGTAGSKLKSSTVTSGFHALLSGFYVQNTLFAHEQGNDRGTMFWTSDHVNPATATARGLNVLNTSVSLYESSRSNAFSVRCIRNW